MSSRTVIVVVESSRTDTFLVESSGTDPDDDVVDVVDVEHVMLSSALDVVEIKIKRDMFLVVVVVVGLTPSQK